MVYKRGKELYVADALKCSQCCIVAPPPANETESYEVMTVDVLSSSRLEELRQETLTDPTCMSVTDIILKGWPVSSKRLPHDGKPYYAMRDEITSDRGLLLRGQRFIIPHSLQQYYLQELHQGHPGVEATKHQISPGEMCSFWG